MGIVPSLSYAVRFRSFFGIIFAVANIMFQCSVIALYPLPMLYSHSQTIYSRDIPMPFTGTFDNTKYHHKMAINDRFILISFFVQRENSLLETLFSNLKAFLV